LKGYFRSKSVHYRADALPSALEQTVVHKKIMDTKEDFIHSKVVDTKKE
jgi:hypothetical protein